MLSSTKSYDIANQKTPKLQLLVIEAGKSQGIGRINWTIP